MVENRRRFGIFFWTELWWVKIRRCLDILCSTQVRRQKIDLISMYFFQPNFDVVLWIKNWSSFDKLVSMCLWRQKIVVVLISLFHKFLLYQTLIWTGCLLWGSFVLMYFSKYFYFSLKIFRLLQFLRTFTLAGI